MGRKKRRTRRYQYVLVAPGDGASFLPAPFANHSPRLFLFSQRPRTVLAVKGTLRRRPVTARP